MNKIDFSFPGQFPLDQQTLDYMQQAYRGGFAGLLYDAVSTPVILSGMTGSHATVLTPGYFAYQGEIYYCPGGTVNPVPPAPAVPLISIVETPTSVTFFDNNTHNVYLQRQGVIGYGTAGGNALDFSTFKTFAQVFGERARASAPTATAALVTPYGSGSATFKLDPMTGIVNMYGNMSVNTSVTTDPAPYFAVGNIPVGFRPVAAVPFAAFVRHHLFVPGTIYSGSDHVRQINCELEVINSSVVMGLLRASAAYNLYFNVTYPIW
jgi:hypothetical protein